MRSKHRTHQIVIHLGWVKGGLISVAEMAISSRSWVACLPEVAASVPSSEEGGTGSEVFRSIAGGRNAGTKTSS